MWSVISGDFFILVKDQTILEANNVMFFYEINDISYFVAISPL